MSAVSQAGLRTYIAVLLGIMTHQQVVVPEFILALKVEFRR